MVKINVHYQAVNLAGNTIHSLMKNLAPQNYENVETHFQYKKKKVIGMFN